MYPNPNEQQTEIMDIFRKRTRKRSTRMGSEAVLPEEWKQVEMAKIKERYQEIEDVILSWEEEKRTKATRKLEETERELERRKKKAVQKYWEEMGYIQEIVAGARAQTQEKRRKEEQKLKQKANIMRETGGVQSSCF